VVGGDAGADGFAVVFRAEGVLEFGLGEVDGLEESLSHVGDGAGGARFDIAADDGGDEAGQGDAEVVGGDVVAGEEGGEVFGELIGNGGAGFFFGVVKTEMGMATDAGSAATAAIGEREDT
jgi:hypothetical protein